MKVKLKILDETGHTELALASEQAHQKVEESLSSGKWVFLDGMFREKVSRRDLESAGEIIISPRLLGG